MIGRNYCFNLINVMQRKENEMGTDWQFIRDTLNAAIDACEKLKILNHTAHLRASQ